MSRPAAGLVIYLLLISAMVMLIPVSPAVGSTGNPTLGVTDTDSTQPTTYTPGAAYVNVTAGSDNAKTDGSTTGFFAIDFGTFGGSQLVSFSGSQFTLYFSKDGLSQVSTGDVRYPGSTFFTVADLTTNAGWHTVHETLGDFHVGQTTGGQEVVVGPLPVNVSNAYQYIKVFDGSTTAIAVGSQTVKLQPNLTLSATSGPAGKGVLVTGGGFPSNKVIELTYSYTYYPWNGASSTKSGNWTTNLSTSSGTFIFSGVMIDAKQVYNPNSGLVPSTPIVIAAKYQASPHALLASATFNEKSRVLTGVLSFDSTGFPADVRNLPPGPYGNGTSTAGANLAQSVNVNVVGSMNIAGNNWLPGTPVTLWIGSTQVGSAVANGTGYFNATITVPVLPQGTYVFQAANSGIAYKFNVAVLPTMTLSPTSGSVGSTVTVQVYGFPANSMFFVYWHEKTLGDAKWYQVSHGTTGPSGTFNESVAFNVPSAYGGVHSVSASTANVTTSSPSSPTTTLTTDSYTVGASSSTTTTTTTVTTTASTTLTVSLTTTQSQTITQTVTQTGTVTQTSTQTQISTQTTTTTEVATSDLTYSYVGLGAAGIAIAGLAFMLLRGRMAR